MSVNNKLGRPTDVEKAVAAAAQWRENEGERDTNRAGVVLVFQGAAYGWKNVLRDPQHERPGAIAVDADGNAWIACGGDDYNGARVWRPAFGELEG